MSIAIEWNSENFASLFEGIPYSTLLQHPAYGRAMEDYEGQTPRCGIILKNGRSAGLVQVLEMKALGGWIHTAALDRGPLWLEGHGGAQDWQEFFRALRAEYPRRLGRVMRIIPETENDACMQDSGFRKKPSTPYKTIWLDLTPGADAMRARLDRSWRNKLSKAERGGLDSTEDTDGKSLPWLLKIYALDKTQRGYEGANPELIKRMHQNGMKFLILKAQQKGVDIAAQLFALHGRSATYQIGWTSPEGREANAHNLLLWKAVQALSKHGIKELDLGGINDQAKGLSDFKAGLGGRVHTLCGVYS